MLSELVDTSTVVQGLAVSAAALVAALQVVELRRARQFKALTEVFDQFHDATHVEARARVSKTSIDGFIDDPEIEMLCRTVCEFFERVAFMSEHRVIRRQHLLDMYSGAIINNYQSLRPYIKFRRQEPNLGKYARNFQNLAGAARRYRDRKYTGTRLRLPRL
jgi:hypothetical protein